MRVLFTHRNVLVKVSFDRVFVFSTQERKKVSDMGKRQEYISDETAQKMATRAWVDSYFPPQEHGIDADEEQDLVERAGSSMVVLTGIYTVEAPGKCTIMCYFPVAACASCIHDGAKPVKAHEPEVQMDLTDVRALLQKY